MSYFKSVQNHRIIFGITLLPWRPAQIHKARQRQLFCTRYGSLDTVPLTFAALKQHIGLRAAYQGGQVRKQVHLPLPELPG